MSEEHVKMNIKLKYLFKNKTDIFYNYIIYNIYNCNPMHKT